MRTTRRYSLFCITASLLCHLVGTGAAAQQPSRAVASPFLDADHWAVAAARRLGTLGLADRSFGWGDGSLTIAAVARVLHDAPSIAEAKHPALVPLAAGYWSRFAREFPASAAAMIPPTSGRVPLSEGWASLGYAEASGRVYPVRSLDRTRENVAGPFPRPLLSEAEAGGTLAITTGSFLAGAISPVRRDGEWSIRDGYVLTSWRKFGVWGGRRAPDFATGAGGGIVFNGTAALTGGGFGFIQPIRLPWILRYLGPIQYEGFLTNVDSNAAIRHPWVMGEHASISPHPRVLIGLTQAFMFGGEGVAPFTWNNFKEMFLAHGINSAGTEFENGIASAEIRFRPPVPVVPLVLYVEWGADDNHAAWTLFPGMVTGVHVPAIPGVPALSLGLERAYFAGPCRPAEPNCHSEYYATWYRHYVFKDGWTLDRQPMGHPLGGEGHEWLVYGTWDDPAQRLRLDARSFMRYRGPYNIYSPARQGRSIGGSLAAVYRVTPHMDLLVNGALEDGQADWRESSFSTGLRWIF